MNAAVHAIAARPNPDRMGFALAALNPYELEEEPSAPSRLRTRGSEDGADEIRERIKLQIEKLQSDLEARISRIENDGEADEAEPGLKDLKDSVKALESQKSFVQTATPAMLYGMQNSMMMANIKGTTADDKSRGTNLAMNGTSTYMSEYYAAEMEKISQKWSEEFKGRAREFERDVQSRGLVGAMQQHDYRYDNVGPAHAYLMKQDPHYQRKTIDLDRRADKRNAEAEADVQRMDEIGKRNEAPVDHGRLDGIKGEIEAAKRNGEVLTQRQKEAELEAARLEEMRKVERAARERGDHTGADATAQAATEQQRRYEDAMRAREEQFKEHTESLRREAERRGELSDPNKKAEFDRRMDGLRQEHEKGTQTLRTSAEKSGYDTKAMDMVIAKTFHDKDSQTRAIEPTTPHKPAITATSRTDSDNAFGDDDETAAKPNQVLESPAIKQAAAGLKEKGVSAPEPVSQQAAADAKVPNKEVQTADAKDATKDKSSARTT